MGTKFLFEVCEKNNGERLYRVFQRRRVSYASYCYWAYVLRMPVKTNIFLRVYDFAGEKTLLRNFNLHVRHSERIARKKRSANRVLKSDFSHFFPDLQPTSLHLVLSIHCPHHSVYKAAYISASVSWIYESSDNAPRWLQLFHIQQARVE